jgi:NADP-dependent 3-hydroxy acid dehydrogenase YdfG
MPQLVWLITSCSSGFGLQFVHSILARGDLVIATARTLSKITQFSSLPDITILELDTTSP